MRTSAPPDRLLPAALTPIAVPPGIPPRLYVVVDTEEEFDWSAPLSRANVGVDAIDRVDLLQDVLEPVGLVPTYVIDYPVAATDSSSWRLADLVREGRCLVGAHLHPWVNPPYEEEVGAWTSYPCNLGPGLERRKLQVLRDAIAERLSVDARMYKAGRYGIGRSTVGTLLALGFDVDLSVNPHMNFSSDGGPDFTGFDASPAWLDGDRRLLELPCTTGFVGLARRGGEAIHRAASSRWLEPVRAVGVLARSGTLNKVMLSPEGSTLEEMCALTETLFRDGLRTFALTFHSPSLEPGCTPYVRSTSDRDRFLATIARYCEFFFERLGGEPTTPMALAELFSHASRGHVTRLPGSPAAQLQRQRS